MRIGRPCSALLLCSLAFAASAKMAHRSVAWTRDGTRFRSVLVYDDASPQSDPAW